MEQEFRRIPDDPLIADWAQAAASVARQTLVQSAEPWRCGGTWFVGVDALANDENGTVAGVALPWDVLGLGPQRLHRAQISVVQRGYPQPSADESEAAFGFRLRRDAAHVDGLLGDAQGGRYLREPHAWVLGIALNDCTATAAPLVVWRGSVAIMRAGLRAAFAGVAEADWPQFDISAPYQAARREVFARCERIELPLRLGEATLLHRLCVHGVAPWGAGAQAPDEGRMIAYFRPPLARARDWLEQP